MPEAVAGRGDVTRHPHTRARDLGPHSLEKTTIALAGARPPLTGTRLHQSDDVIRHLGAARRFEEDMLGRSRRPALIDDPCHDRGVPCHEGGVQGTAGVEVVHPGWLLEVGVEAGAN